MSTADLYTAALQLKYSFQRLVEYSLKRFQKASGDADEHLWLFWVSEDGGGGVADQIVWSRGDWSLPDELAVWGAFLPQPNRSPMADLLHHIPHLRRFVERLRHLRTLVEQDRTRTANTPQ